MHFLQSIYKIIICATWYDRVDVADYGFRDQITRLGLTHT